MAFLLQIQDNTQGNDNSLSFLLVFWLDKYHFGNLVSLIFELTSYQHHKKVKCYYMEIVYMPEVSQA